MLARFYRSESDVHGVGGKILDVREIKGSDNFMKLYEVTAPNGEIIQYAIPTAYKNQFFDFDYDKKIFSPDDVRAILEKCMQEVIDAR